MDNGAPLKGLELTDSIHKDFQQLLNILGDGNLLHDSTTSASSVPTKWKDANTEVTQLLARMKQSLKEVRTHYDVCYQEMTIHKNLLSLESLKQDQTTQSKDKSDEYNNLATQLRSKNGELKQMIIEMRELSTCIQQAI